MSTIVTVDPLANRPTAPVTPEGKRLFAYGKRLMALWSPQRAGPVSTPRYAKMGRRKPRWAERAPTRKFEDPLDDL